MSDYDNIIRRDYLEKLAYTKEEDRISNPKVIAIEKYTLFYLGLLKRIRRRIHL